MGGDTVRKVNSVRRLLVIQFDKMPELMYFCCIFFGRYLKYLILLQKSLLLRLQLGQFRNVYKRVCYQRYAHYGQKRV